MAEEAVKYPKSEGVHIDSGWKPPVPEAKSEGEGSSPKKCGKKIKLRNGKRGCF